MVNDGGLMMVNGEWLLMVNSYDSFHNGY